MRKIDEYPRRDFDVGRDGMAALWRFSLACFLIAGMTGALFRFGFVFGFPPGLDPGHLRHAHSHLMYFGWTTPAIMALIAANLNRRGVSNWRFASMIIWLTLALGLSVFPAFLTAGYKPVPVFGVRLPIASILSSLNMPVWYVFGGWYWWTTRREKRTESLKLWDAALGFLWLSTVGSWGRMILEMRHIDMPVLADLAVHLFLTLFSQGWLALAALGLAFSFIAEGAGGGGRMEGGRPWAYGMLIVGVLLSSLLGSGLEELSSVAAVIGGIGGLSAAVGIGYYLFRLWHLMRRSSPFPWMPVLLFLAAIIVLQLVLAFPAVRTWGEKLGLRIVYLHTLTLGVASTSLIASARETWGSRAAPSPHIFALSVLVLVVGLVVITPIWPVGSGQSRLLFAAFTSLLPLAIVVPKVMNRGGRSVRTKARRAVQSSDDAGP